MIKLILLILTGAIYASEPPEYVDKTAHIISKITRIMRPEGLDIIKRMADGDSGAQKDYLRHISQIPLRVLFVDDDPKHRSDIIDVMRPLKLHPISTVLPALDYKTSNHIDLYVGSGAGEVITAIIDGALMFDLIITDRNMDTPSCRHPEYVERHYPNFLALAAAEGSEISLAAGDCLTHFFRRHYVGETCPIIVSYSSDAPHEMPRFAPRDYYALKIPRVTGFIPGLLLEIMRYSYTTPEGCAIKHLKAIRKPSATSEDEALYDASWSPAVKEERK